MEEQQKELIDAIKKLNNSIEKLTILFEFVKKELIEDYDKKDNSEALLKKLVQQNKVIAQGMVELNNKHQEPQTTPTNQNPTLNELQKNNSNQPEQKPQNNQIPENPNFSQPEMDFSEFESLTTPTPTPPPMPPKNPNDNKKEQETQKGFLGMFKK